MQITVILLKIINKILLKIIDKIFIKNHVEQIKEKLHLSFPLSHITNSQL